MQSPNQQAPLHKDHSPEAIRRRLERGPKSRYLRDWVFGAIDGTVTTFAIVSGVVGADLSNTIIIILGAANLLADGFSMAVSNFLSNRAERLERRATAREEERHIDRFPEGEREEIRQIFARKGFTGEELEHVVEVITADRKQWIETMLIEEHGMILEHRSPWRAAGATFLAFGLVGCIPLLPYIVGAIIGSERNLFAWSATMTAMAFVFVGVLKSRFTHQRQVVAAMETLGVGAIAATVAFVVAAGLRQLVIGS